MTAILNYNADAELSELNALQEEKYTEKWLLERGSVFSRAEIALEKRIALLAVLTLQARYRGRIFSRMSTILENKDQLLDNLPEHDCRDGECRILSQTAGRPIYYALTGERGTSSGTIHICAVTGRVHECSDLSPCDAMEIDLQDRCAGYIFRITHRHKRGVTTSLAPIDPEKNPISKHTSDLMAQAEDTRIAFRGDMNSSEECREDDSDVEIGEMLGSVGKNLRRKPKVSVEPERRRGPIKKRQPMTGTDRSVNYLKQMTQKQRQATTIVKLLLNTELQMRYYQERQHVAARKAFDHVNMQKGRALRDFSRMDCISMWYKRYYEVVDTPPTLVGSIKPNVYVNSIMELWEKLATSLYARQRSSSKHKPLNFQKIAFAYMYQLTAGDYVCNCSLSEAVIEKYSLHTVAPELAKIVGDFGIRVITLDPHLREAIAHPDSVVALSKMQRTTAKPEPKTITHGTKLLKGAINSIYYGLRQECIAELAKNTDKAAVLQTYIDCCKENEIQPTYERGRVGQQL